MLQFPKFQLQRFPSKGFIISWLHSLIEQFGNIASDRYRVIFRIYKDDRLETFRSTSCGDARGE